MSRLATTNPKTENIEAICALSPMQEGLLFHALLTPDSPVYFEQVSCRLGRLEHPEMFRQAWQRAVDRHPALRTAFYWKNGKRPLQIARTVCELSWIEEDWRDAGADEFQARLDSLLEADRRRLFDLSKAPLMRCTLIRLSDCAYQFVWSHHHLILDGWSAGIVVKEVLSTYAAMCAGRDLCLPAPRPFRDYIGWLAKRGTLQDEAFWRQNLSNLAMPTRIGPAQAGGAPTASEAEYAERETCLSATVTSALQELAQQHRLTLNCLVQGAWACLLSRRSGDDDVLFGSTVSGRPPELTGVEDMVGVFINALPVRVRVDSKATLLPWLQQLMTDQVEREQHAYNSLVEIHSWSDVPQGEPLFESLVIYENYPLRKVNSSIEIDDLRSFRRANYPLTLVVTPDDALHLELCFDTSRFDAATIEQMLEQLRLILEQIAARPNQQLRQLTLLSSHERALVAQWNDTAAPYPAEKCVPDLFADWVCQMPDAVAAVFGQDSLTYRALDARTNQLAGHLRDLGVGPETLVGVCVERSLEMLVAVLGILKAGGAYVPLDPAYPEERLAFMIEDSGVPVLLTSEPLLDRMPALWAQVVLLDADWPAIASHRTQYPTQPGITSDNLAYVIYTSGSTGNPKGVQVTHRGLSNLATAQSRLFAPLAGGHVLQFASLSFDASIWEIVMALCCGATLHLATKESLLPGRALADELEHSGITHVTLPPSALDLIPETQLPALRNVIVAGEACSLDLVDRWSAGRRFVNAYGPTETTVCATAWIYNGEQQPLPIGRPLPNTRAYPLDGHLNPLPPGVAGELHLGGVNLARGYLKRAALTAERFVPDPVSAEPGGRLYNTGDLACYRPDGAILFLGRSDHQVKVRGHRIELGEIEAALSLAAGVKQNVVVARKNPGGDSLVAYVVTESADSAANGTSSEGLREHLRARLPEHMIPSLFVHLDSLPLSPNGKIDRKALPAPGEAGTQAGTRAFRPPRDILEQRLVTIWEQVLGVHPIGVEDNFFLLGGHSLLAVRLMAWIEKELGQHLPLATLFKGPTIAQLSAILRVEGNAPTWSSLVAVQAAGSQRPVFFVPGGGGNVIYLYALAHHIGMDRPFYGLQARGLDGVSEPHASIEEMAAAYLAEIRTVQPNGPYLLAGHSSGSWVAFEMACQLQSRGEQAAMVAVIDTPAPVPDTKSSDVDEDEALFLVKVVRLIERWAGKELDVTYEVLQPLTAAEQMDYLVGRLKSVDLLPPQAGRAQAQGLLQVFKASTRNCVRYVARGTYRGAVTLLRATEIHIEDTGIRINLRVNDETWGWSQPAGEHVDVRIVPGDHITMMAEPHVRCLAAELAACIHEAEGALGDLGALANHA